MKIGATLPATLFLLCITSPVGAATLGDPAPPVTIERWIKGTPVRVQPGTNFFVVECWATWCAPCKKSIPHLTELQAKYAAKGVIFIGISDEPAATVIPFVTAKGSSMNYRVAVDPSRRTLDTWMGAFGKDGIPHAYIIGKDGRVLWQGMPLSGLDRALEQILDGSYDLEFERNADVGERLVTEYTALASKPSDSAKAADLGGKILAEYSRDWRIPYRLSKAILTEPSVRKRDLDLAMTAAKKAVESSRRGSYQSLEMLARAQFATGNKQEAVATQKEALAVCNDPEDRAELEKFLAVFQKNAK